jgi:selenocysteine-specific elongation factor
MTSPSAMGAVIDILYTSPIKAKFIWVAISGRGNQTACMKKNLILGTAGHIDHGKTSLILALTGTDTDRLPEEKRRGITIEPGYARLELQNATLGVVDVPGHEKFVRQMLSGASGIDLALLVVAADDSIKPQTREHFEILKLLQLRLGVIAITKCDLVDDPENWLPLVEEEIRELVRGSFLADAPIVQTSSKSNLGIDQLKSTLTKLVDQYIFDDDSSQQPFRMPIDRVFVKEGHGTVVTGSVSSGQANLNDTLEIQPGDISVRVRGIHNHDKAVETIVRGQRAAINLAGVHHEAIGRGHELAGVGYLKSSQLMFATLHLLESTRHILKDREVVRFHIGTTEIVGRIRTVEKASVKPGESCIVQVFLAEPAVAVWNQPFVIRRQSPMETLGGGHILHPNAVRLRRPDQTDLTHLQNLASSDEANRVSAAIYFAGLHPWSIDQLQRTVGVNRPKAMLEKLSDDGVLTNLQISPTRTLTLHRDMLGKISSQIVATLNRLHDANQLASLFSIDVISAKFSHLPDKQVLNCILAQLQKQKTIRLINDRIGLINRGPQLTNNEQKLHDQIVQQFQSSGLAPPTIKELSEKAAKNKESVPALVKLAVDNGLLVMISSDFYLHSDTLTKIKQDLASHFQKSHQLTMSEIRSILETSRKYAVPLCEYLDRSGFTIRQGDTRTLSISANTA